MQGLLADLSRFRVPGLQVRHARSSCPDDRRRRGTLGSGASSSRGARPSPEAMVAAGCRFFAGYPMTPFTEVLEAHGPDPPRRRRGVHERGERARGGGDGLGGGSDRYPGGDRFDRARASPSCRSHWPRSPWPACPWSSSTWPGPRVTTTRPPGVAATGTTATSCWPRPMPAEAVELVGLAFDLAERWRNPVAGHGRLLPRPHRPVGDHSRRRDPCRPRVGPRRLVGRLRPRQAGLLPRAPPSNATTWATTCRSTTRPAPQATVDMVRQVEPLAELTQTDDAEVVVVAFGTPGRYVKAAVRQLRAEGIAVGCVRPDHALPVPHPDHRRCRAGRPGGGRLREQPGTDDRRRAAGRARHRPGPISSAG